MNLFGLGGLPTDDPYNGIDSYTNGLYTKGFSGCILFMSSFNFVETDDISPVEAGGEEKCVSEKWTNPGLFYVYFRLFKQTFQFLQQKYVKISHPVAAAGIRTHDHHDTSLLP